MHSLSRYSRANQINKQWTEEYLNAAHSFGLTSVRCHCNVIAWSEDHEQLKRIKNDVGSQLALMECKPRHNTVDTPTLYWAGIPAMQEIFLQKKVSIRLLNKPCACLQKKPITDPPQARSGSKWLTV